MKTEKPYPSGEIHHPEGLRIDAKVPALALLLAIAAAASAVKGVCGATSQFPEGNMPTLENVCSDLSPRP